MKKISNIFMLLVVALMGLSLTACSEDDLDTNQYKAGVSLNVYGPQPVMRGGTLRFLGSNLDQIAQVQIPGCDPITNIEVIKSGVPSEIRVTLPKDGPEVGYVTLVSKTDDKITTKTQLTYIEGIEFGSFSPESVMPGETVTINGEYLNLVHMIEFTDGVYVSEDDFISHDRYKIEVAVPENAQTGKVNLYDTDLTKIVDATSTVTYNIIESDVALNIGTPTVSKFTSPRGEAELTGTVTAKMGETITVTGSDFQLICGLMFGDLGEDGDGTIFVSTDFTVSEDGKTITFTLPEEAPDGSLNLVCKSGVSVPVGNIVTVAPSNCVATPDPVKAGAALTITGKDLDVVNSIEMPGVDAETEIAFTKAEDGTSLVITAVPETATEGNLVLRMKNGKGVEVPFTLVKPVVTGYGNASVSAGGVLTINGTNLDLVKSVQFGEGSDVVTALNVTDDGTSLSLTVPMNATSGKPTLTLANGTTVEGIDLTVEEAVFCYATALPGEDVELKAGGTMTLTVANGDKLTGVEINGTACQYILSGDQLIIGIPETAGKGAKVRLVSSNGEITYTLDITPSTEVFNTVWSGMTEITWNEGGRVIIPASAFEDVPAGAVLTLCYTQKDQTWAQAQINYADWSGINFTTGDVKVNQTLVPTDVYGWFTDGILSRETPLVLTQEILDNILAKRAECENVKDAGIVIQGTDLVFTKVTLSYKRSLETTIWTGSWECSNWAGNQELAWGGYDWNNVKAGSTLRLYYTKTVGESEWGCISLRHGTGWGALPEPIKSQYDFPEGASGVVEVTLPQNVLDDIKDNGGLVITGDKFILNKVTIE